MTSNSLIQVKNLTIGFKNNGDITPAVLHSNFHVEPGKTLAIVGESGSGKSVSSLSLMKLLHKEKAVFSSGQFILHPSLFDDCGEARIIEPSDPILERLRGHKIAMIFQEPMTSLNPVMTCGDQVQETLIKHTGVSHEKARERACSLFEEVKLPRPEAILNSYPHQLSGGQRQRVMIAMAIACEPKLLIADEPTTALDVTVQKEILLLLQQLQLQRNMAMIFITHDLGVVEEIADDILVMKRGGVVEYGAAQEILSNPQHAYTRGLLQCRPQKSKKDKKLLTVRDFELAQNPIAEPRLQKTIYPRVFLEVQGVSKIYRGESLFKKNVAPVRAVDRVSFHINKGETLGLVGESGCGKTTLSRMLLGLIPTSEGTIRYTLNSGSQFDIANMKERDVRSVRKDIQIIFQDPYSSLNPKHTIAQALTEPMAVHRIGLNYEERRLLAIALMERVGLSSSQIERYPHEFSGGQRQRIVIARALACKPSFIICDESVSALDVSVQAQVLNLLNELKFEYDLTYLFISHDLRVVHYMSDRIMVMNKGKIEEIGESDDVFNRPQSPYTQKLLEAVPGSDC
jgi:peptide/nickel transport system ATP-binding protein